MLLKWEEARKASTNGRSGNGIDKAQMIRETPEAPWTHAGCSVQCPDGVFRFIRRQCHICVLGHQCQTWPHRFPMSNSCKMHSDERNELRRCIPVKVDTNTTAVKFLDGNFEAMHLSTSIGPHRFRGSTCVEAGCDESCDVPDRDSFPARPHAASFFCSRHDAYTERCMHGMTKSSCAVNNSRSRTASKPCGCFESGADPEAASPSNDAFVELQLLCERQGCRSSSGLPLSAELLTAVTAMMIDKPALHNSGMQPQLDCDSAPWDQSDAFYAAFRNT